MKKQIVTLNVFEAELPFNKLSRDCDVLKVMFELGKEDGLEPEMTEDIEDDLKEVIERARMSTSTLRTDDMGRTLRFRFFRIDLNTMDGEEIEESEIYDYMVNEEEIDRILEKRFG